MQSNGKTRHVFQWHITHACNLRCTHCYQDDYQYSMPSKELFSILDKYTTFVHQNNYLGQINLTGGEPLLHPDFFSLASEIKKRGFRLGILTNGTLIDDQLADQLRDLHPVFVQISLDGTRRQHDAIRGKGAFQKALRGIRLLKSRGIRVLVSFTAQKENLSSFPELARICRFYRVDKLWWDRVVTDNPQDYAALALTTEEFRNFLSRNQRLEKWYRRPDGSYMISNQRALQFLGCSNSKRSYICAAGKTLFAVLADGSVMACRRLPVVIGNAQADDFQSILNGSEWIRMLRERSCPESCMLCRYVNQCSGGAKCITYGQTGTLDQRDPNCFADESARCGICFQ